VNVIANNPPNHSRQRTRVPGEREPRDDQLIPEPLMIPFPMVVRHELVDGAAEPTFPEEDQTVEHSLRIERTKRSA
jgi:hypothetical protein